MRFRSEILKQLPPLIPWGDLGFDIRVRYRVGVVRIPPLGKGGRHPHPSWIAEYSRLSKVPLFLRGVAAV